MRATKSSTLGALRWATMLLVLSAVSCQAAIEQPEVAQEPPAAESPAPSPPPASPVPEECSSSQRQSIEQVIENQSRALTAGDWETAYSFASPSFRAAVTIDQFERVVTRQYDMLLTFESADFGRCEVLAPGRAGMIVEVRSALYRPVIMVYEVVNAEDRWFVNGVQLPVSAVPNA